MRVLVLDGPNLNLLGTREPEVYGRVSLAEIHEELRALAGTRGVSLTFFQSNSEGQLVDAVQKAPETADAILINPGGLTHTSVSLLDALLAVRLPCVEVHLTNTACREEFRQTSLVARAAAGRVEGFGPDSYRLGLLGLIEMVKRTGGATH
jgi:3-dehydroquinate dehydratase-2